jgi:asparagine synthase (glutamine-hydrolysing)
MSGIVAIFQRDGAPVSDFLWQKLNAAAPHRNRNGSGNWRGGEVGLIQMASPGGVVSAPPLHGGNGGLALAFDGRLDNREELYGALQLAHSVEDVEIVRGAYRRWGEDCAARLLGDFAFALWDAPRRRLFCARDIIGARPFYYHAGPEFFLCASEPAQLFAHEQITHQANEVFTGAFLADSFISVEETFHRHIKRLPPAHTLTITPDNLKIKRYWDINAGKTVRYRRDEDYAEHFHHLLREAVLCRWRGAGRAGVLLSGGLDSTAIAVIARELRNEGKIEDSTVKSYSQIYPGEAVADESEYIRETVRQLALEAELFPPFQREAGAYQENVDIYHNVPDYPNDSMWDDLRRTALAQGTRILLSGTGGDEWFTGSLYHHADWLRQGRFTVIWRQARAESKRYALPLWRLLWQYAVKPYTPLSVVNSYRRLRGRFQYVPDWIEPGFALRIGLGSRIQAAAQPVFPQSKTLDEMLSVYHAGVLFHTQEAHGRLNARFGVEVRQPFNDRRLIEFGLGLPEEQRWRGAETKYVLRRALRGRMPEAVLKRTNKAEFSRVFVNELQRQAGASFFSSLTLAQRGWLNGPRVRQLYEEMAQRSAQNDQRHTWHVWRLWHIFGLELMARRGFI